jgi:hypothetical protein
MKLGDEMERTLITSAEQLNNLSDQETAFQTGPKRVKEKLTKISSYNRNKPMTDSAILQCLIYSHLTTQELPK